MAVCLSAGSKELSIMLVSGGYLFDGRIWLNTVIDCIGNTNVVQD